MIRGRGVVKPEAVAEEVQSPEIPDKFKRKVRGGSPESEQLVSIKINPPNRKLLRVTIVGDTGYIAHRMSRQVRDVLQDYGQTTKAERKARPKTKRDPEAEFKASLYPVPGKEGEYGIPGSAFRRAAVVSAGLLGLSMAMVARLFWIVEEVVPVEGGTWSMREDAVKLMGKTASLTYRAFLDVPYKATFNVSYNANVLAPETIVNLLNEAGTSVGIGDWRLEKMGRYGAFHVEGAEPVLDLPTTHLSQV